MNPVLFLFSLHQKVGLFMDADVLRSRLARAPSSAGDVTSEPVRCLACHVNKKVPNCILCVFKFIKYLLI